MPVSYQEVLAAEGAQVVDRVWQSVAEAFPRVRISTDLIVAPTVRSLVELSKQAQMVVIGCRGNGQVERALLGSVSSGLVHHAHCPVAIIHDEKVPDGQPPSDAPVLVGVDGSPMSDAATAIAFDEASRRGVDLVALHAWSDMGPIEFASVNWAPIEWRNIRDQEEEVLSERLSGYQERYPDVTVHKVVVADRPTLRLLEKAKEAQLVVLGSHGRGGIPGMLLGSVSAATVNAAEVPVIIARRPH